MTISIASDATIFVAGHAGLVGSAVMRRLEAEGFTNIVTARRDQLDLREQAAVNYWFRANRPEYVYLVAGTVGGIMANNTYRADFIYENTENYNALVVNRRSNGSYFTYRAPATIPDFFIS